ncbi:MAG: NADH-quinone oxidoreductase subunit A [Candidatus Dasytiphilus stammeri]
MNFNSYTEFIFYCSISMILCGVILLLSWILGDKSHSRNKNLPFESGINSVGSARLRFSARFFLVAILFVIFDVEAIYLYIWSITIRETGWLGLIEATMFIFVLLMSLIYLLRFNALEGTLSKQSIKINSDENKNEIYYNNN